MLVDLELDIALLLRGRPARRRRCGSPAASRARGDVGATVGYPGRRQRDRRAGDGGRDLLRDRPRRDRRGAGHAPDHRASGAVVPGDSGGPFVLEDGTVGGVVFAESQVDPAVGYALVAARGARAIGSSAGASVATGRASPDAGRCVTERQPGDVRRPGATEARIAVTRTDATSERGARAPLADEFWDGYLAAYPTWATVIGDRRFDDRLEDVVARPRSRRGLALARRASRAAPAAIDPAALDVDGAGHPPDAHRRGRGPRAPRSGPGSTSGPSIPLGGPDGRACSTSSTTRRSRRPRTAARSSRAGAGSGGTSTSMRREPARGGRGRAASPSAKPVERVLDVLAQPRGDAGGGSGSSRRRRSAEHRRLVARRTGGGSASGILAAVREVGDPGVPALPRDPRAATSCRSRDPTTSPALVHLPGGARGLPRPASASTRRSTSTPEEIHATGLAEIERIDAEFVELGGRVLGTTDLAVDPGRAARRPAPPLRDRGRGVRDREALPRPRQAAVADWFGRDPGRRLRRRARSRATPRSTRRSPTTRGRRWTAAGRAATTSTSTPPRRGRATRPRRSRSTRPCPGHHLQIAVAQELRGPARRSSGCSARPPSPRAGACTRSASRTRWASTPPTWTGSGSCRTTRGGPAGSSSTPGMHALGWTRQQAIDFLKAHTRPRREQHRQRGRSVHRLARPGAGLQDRPAGDPAAARRGQGAARRRVRHQGLPRHRARRRRDQPAGAAGSRRGLAGRGRRRLGRGTASARPPGRRSPAPGVALDRRSIARGSGDGPPGSVSISRSNSWLRGSPAARTSLTRGRGRRPRPPLDQRDLAEEAAGGHRADRPVAVLDPDVPSTIT